MFSKTALFAFVLAAALSSVAQAQTTTMKMATTSSKSESKTVKASATTSKASAKSAKAPAAAQGQSVSIVQLNNLNLNANASSTSQVLHPVAGRSIFQAVPKGMTSTIETKLGKAASVSTETRTNAVGIEYARGLSNDMSLNISTDMGASTSKSKNSKETTNSGLSDLKVELRKMNQQDMQQSFLAGQITSSLGAATRGSYIDNKNIDGNRFSGGMTLGGSYTKQTAALAGNYGYKLSAALQFNRKVDIQQPTPVYSATEYTGGHMLAAEAFGEKIIGQASKIGGSIGLDVTLPTEVTTRTGTDGGAATIDRLNVMSLKAFAALSAGQLEFIPTAIFQKNIGNSGGDSSIESLENVGIELITRFSL